MKNTPLFFKKVMRDAIYNTQPGVWPAQPINPALPFKWQTRRPVNMARVLRATGAVRANAITETSLHEWNQDVTPAGLGGFIFWQTTFELTPDQHAFHLQQYANEEGIACPYGAPGDRLWGRERMFQPKISANFWLELKQVRVERVRDISEADALAEGMAYEVMDMAIIARDYRSKKSDYFQDWDDTIGHYHASPLAASYQSLWEKIHKAKHPWDSTWVWVLDFMVLPEGAE